MTTTTSSVSNVCAHFKVAHHFVIVLLYFSEDGDQDGEGGDLEGSNNSLGLLSQISMESRFPSSTSLDLNKQGTTRKF